MYEDLIIKIVRHNDVKKEFRKSNTISLEELKTSILKRLGNIEVSSNQLWDRYEFKNRIISAKSLNELKDRDLYYGTGGWRIEVFDVAEYYRDKNKGWSINSESSL